MTRLKNHFSINDFKPTVLNPESQAELLRVFHHDPFTYYALSVPERERSIWYLFACENEHLNSEQSEEEKIFADYVLGVFDTVGQLEFFLNLHTENALKIPALKVLGNKCISLSENDMRYPHYEGVYRVGYKSYRVAPVGDSKHCRAEFINGYKVELLGEYTEIEACIAVYSHFHQRLRSCSMC